MAPLATLFGENSIFNLSIIKEWLILIHSYLEFFHCNVVILFDDVHHILFPSFIEPFVFVPKRRSGMILDDLLQVTEFLLS